MSKKVIGETEIVMDDLEDLLAEDPEVIPVPEAGMLPEVTEEVTEPVPEETERSSEDETSEAERSEEKTPSLTEETSGEEADVLTPDFSACSDETGKEEKEAEKPEEKPVFAPKIADLAGEETGGPAFDGELKGMEDPEPEEEKEEKPEAGYPWKKILAVTVATLLFAVAVFYGAGVYYYSVNFLPGTYVDHVEIGNRTPAEASALLTETKKETDGLFTLKTIEGESVSMDISAMGITRNYLGLEEALKAQPKWAFPLETSESRTLSLSYELSYDAEEAAGCLNALPICDASVSQPPADSEVARDETGTWVVTEAVDGNTIDTEILCREVVKAVSEKKNELDIDGCGAYLKAGIREDDPVLNKKVAMENAIDDLSFTIDLGAGTFYAIGPDLYRDLLKDGLEAEEHPEVFLDSAALDRFIEKLARVYDTRSPSGYRYFKSVTGKKIIMETDYGWEMDQEQTKEVLGTMLVQAAKILCGDTSVRETYPNHQVTAVWKQTAVSHGERDTGESWVEVNLTTQKMYCIIDGETKLESNVTSGTETVEERRTPAGIFSLRFKATNRDLVGYNPDGTEAYRSHVNYWMPVYNNIGLHDATWRSSFGGNRYLYNGSHGCVNLPLKAAKELYEMIDKGISVIFYRETL